jgi:hypothetical protein
VLWCSMGAMVKCPVEPVSHGRTSGGRRKARSNRWSKVYAESLSNFAEGRCGDSTSLASEVYPVLACLSSTFSTTTTFATRYLINHIAELSTEKYTIILNYRFVDI